MQITLDLHRECPPTPSVATNAVATPDEAVAFLAEALERMTQTIAPGESREVGIGVRVTA